MEKYFQYLVKYRSFGNKYSSGIAVATLLVAVVGATFAYFTATNESTGSGGSEANVQTAETSGISLSIEPATATNPDTLYPGGYLVSAAQVKATKDGDKDYTVTYTLNFEVDAHNLSADSKVKYSLYRTKSLVSNPVTDCTLETSENATEGGNKVHMTNCAVSGDLGAAKVAGTEIIGGTAKQSLTWNETEGVSTDDETGYYYYLLVEFVDNEEAQDDDQGKQITAKITSASSAVVKEKTA